MSNSLKSWNCAAYLVSTELKSSPQLTAIHVHDVCCVGFAMTSFEAQLMERIILWLFNYNTNPIDD